MRQLSGRCKKGDQELYNGYETKSVDSFSRRGTICLLFQIPISVISILSLSLTLHIKSKSSENSALPKFCQLKAL